MDMNSTIKLNASDHFICCISKEDLCEEKKINKINSKIYSELTKKDPYSGPNLASFIDIYFCSIYIPAGDLLYTANLRTACI